MNTILILTLYLPPLVALGGFITVALWARKNATLWVLEALAGAATIFYVFDTMMVNPEASLPCKVAASVIVPCMSPFVLAFLIVFVWKVYNEKRLIWYHYLWFAAPISLCSACIMLCYFLGEKNLYDFMELQDRLRHFPEQYQIAPMYKMLHFIQEDGYKTLLTIYSLWIVAFCIMALKKTGFTLGALKGFTFKKASIPPMHLLLLDFTFLLFTIAMRAFCGRYFLFDNMWLNSLLAILQAIFLMGVVVAAFALDYVEVTLRQTFFFDVKEDLQQIALDEASENEINEEEEEEAETTATSSPQEDKEDAFRLVQERLDAGLRELMEDKHYFLDCELRLVDVAQKLCTNRNYLSRHINEKYGINFNEYINRMRIEYSKQYMLDNPNQLLDVIAVECGFGTAQSYGRKFKAMEGMTPRTWLVRNIKKK